jgi:hypothetical protein
MYDFIRFEIDAFEYKDLDKKLPLDYPRYAAGDFACWTDCGCHWLVSCPISEEFQFREWLMDAGIQITKYDYIQRAHPEEQKIWLLEYLEQKLAGLKKFMSDTEEFHVDMGLYTAYQCGTRYQLIYVDADDVENLYGTHTRPIDLYKEAITILGKAIEDVRQYPRPITQSHCGISGFYNGRNVSLMNLEGQYPSKKEIKLFDLTINSDYKTSLLAVRTRSEPTEKVNGRRVTIV